MTDAPALRRDPLTGGWVIVAPARAMNVLSWCPIGTQRPKSMIFATLSLPYRMFFGQKSRWMRPWWWM